MKYFLIAICCLTLVSCKSDTKKQTTVTQTTEDSSGDIAKKTSFKVTPISHATMVLEINGVTIYVDPVGDPSAFNNMPQADLILVTDIHGDHLNKETLAAVSNKSSQIIMPQACVDKISNDFKAPINVLNNAETKEFLGVAVTAVPMYNLREEDKNKHVKGRGNGYVLEMYGQRVYISGDTEDIPEMRALKDIDVAFVCMNLPYTMTVESAADAVIEFAPKTVYPYHYRGANGLSDVAKFNSLVTAANKEINVNQLDWYAQ